MKHTIADAVVFECDLPQSRDKVWRALTERELLAAWLMPNDIRPEVGAKFQLQPGRAGDQQASVERSVHKQAPVERSGLQQAPVECEVLQAEPGRILRWRQREPADAVSSRYCIESVVSFELADSPDGGTHLRVVHDGFTTVARCSNVVALRPRAQAATAPVPATTTADATARLPAITRRPAIPSVICSLRRAA